MFLSLYLEISSVGHFCWYVVEVIKACIEQIHTLQSDRSTASQGDAGSDTLNFQIRAHTHFSQTHKKAHWQPERAINNVCSTCSQTVST